VVRRLVEYLEGAAEDGTAMGYLDGFTAGWQHILVSIQEQRRHVDAGKHVTQIGFRRRKRHCPEPGGAANSPTRSFAADFENIVGSIVATNCVGDQVG
jgi:hypothetical protein